MEICKNSEDDIKMCPLCADKTCQPWSLFESCLYAKVTLKKLLNLKLLETFLIF